MAQTTGDRRLLGEEQILLALALYDHGDLGRAADYCQAALDTYATLGDEYLLTRARTLMDALQPAA